MKQASFHTQGGLSSSPTVKRVNKRPQLLPNSETGEGGLFAPRYASLSPIRRVVRVACCTVHTQGGREGGI